MQTTRSLLYTSAAVLSLVTAGSAFAAPEGGVVARGSATITQSGKKTDIRQSSNKVILDWRSFDIGADEHTEFHQPSKNAIALNRINDTKASRIDGKLSANGHIMLINPNGVVFGAGAQVDVGSLTATTADIDNDDFMAGKMDFKNAGNTAGAIINHGSISVKDAGLVNFVAPKVENNGVIVAKLGKVQLAAADTFTLDMAGDGVLQVAVSEEDSQKIARNSGSITAEGGYVAVTAAKARGLVDSLVDNTGVIEASSMSAKGGKIILSADGGTTRTSGTIKANGQSGGGNILIGGDYQGKGATKNSKTTKIASTAVIEASATAAGDGGSVIVWSDEKTDVAGSITAKGGAISGKGGFVETSSKKLLNVDAATTIAVGGKSGAGEWLVDPEDIVISDAGNDGNPATSDIATATINGTLNGGGNVTITTSGVPAGNGDITVTNAAINKSTANNDATLTLQAHRNIVMNNSTINSTSGDALNVVLNADRDANQNGTISVTDSTITTHGGYVVAGGGAGAVGGTNGILGDGDGTGADDVAATASGSGNGITFTTSNITTAGGSVIMNGRATGAGTAHGIDIDRTNISTGAGDIRLVGHSTGNTSNPKGITLGGSASGMSLLTTDGDISLIATSTGSQAIYLWEDVVISTTNGDIDITASNGNGIADLAAGGATPTNTISSTNGDVSLTMDDVNLTDFQSISAGGTLSILPYNAATTIGLGGGAGDLNLTDVELSRLGGSGKLVIGNSAGGGGNVVIQSWDLSSKLFDTEIYGNNITIGGLTMGQDFMAYAMAGVNLGDMNISANITRAVNGDATLDLRADRNIVNSNNSDIVASDANSDGDANAATSPDRLSVILNSDRNANGSGAVALTNAAITTLGGDFIVGGGLDPLANATRASNREIGIEFNNTQISTAAGSISMTGQGENNGNDNFGISLTNGSSLHSTDGDITLTGYGGNGVSGNLGLYFQSSRVESDNGDIQLTGTGGTGYEYNYGIGIAGSSTVTSSYGTISLDATSGSNGLPGTRSNDGLVVEGGSVISSTGTGAGAATISIDATGATADGQGSGLYLNNGSILTKDGDIDIIGHTQYYAGIALGNNAVIEADGSADITLTGTETVGLGAGALQSANGSNRIGGANTTGTITLIGDTINYSNITIETDGTTHVKAYTPTTTIGLGGGGGTLNLNDSELSYFNGTGTLVIGDAALGTGDMDVDSWDFSAKSFDVELYGNDIDIGGLTMGAGDVMAYAKDNGVDYGDLNISANITRAVDGEATLDLRADRSITNSNGADIVASDSNSDADGNAATDADSLNITLNADRDGDQDGAVELTNATMTTLGGDFVAGGGSGALGGTNGILGDGDGTGADDTAAWGNSTSLEGLRLDATSVSTGTGSIYLTGHGWNTTSDDNHGVYATYSSLSTGDGSININGTAGIGGSNNRGVYLFSTNVNAAGTGDIIIEGRGNNSTSVNAGSYNVGVTQEYGTISAHGGLLDIRGYGGTTNSWFSNYGFEISGSANITNSNAGDIYIFGQSNGTSANNNAIRVWNDTNSISTSGSGDITLEATTASPGLAVDLTSANSVRTTGTGDIILVTDSLGLAVDGAVNAANNVYLGPRTSGASMTLGNTTGSTANFGDAVFSHIVADRVIVGNDAGGNGDVVVDSLDLSTRTYDLEIYGNDVTLSGLTIGAGDFMAHAKDNGVDYGDLNISANITRAVDGEATLDLRADRSITNSNGADIVASDGNSDADGNAATDSDSLNIILNADRDGDHDGYVAITDATITTLGGDFVAGGGGGALGGTNGILGDGDGTGADDVMAWGNTVIGRGVTLTTSAVSTGAGMIVLNGRGYDDISTTSHHGINLLTSALSTTSGSMLMKAEGGDSSQNAYGFHSNGSTISTVSGDVSINGVGGTSPMNDAAMVFFNSSVLESTGSGSIYLVGTGSINNGNFSIGAGGANRIGHASMTGDIEITVDSVAISDTDNTILTQGDIYLKPLDVSQSIGLGGGGGSFNLTAGELSNFNGTGKLVIGDAAGGTGDIDLNIWNLSTKSFDVELYGNDIDIGSLTMGAGDFMAYAKNNGVDHGDLIVSAAVTRGVAGVSALDLDADRNITFNSGATITSTTGEIDLEVDADYDSAGGGSIVYNAASIDTNGGDITFADAVAVGADVDWNARGGTFTSGGAITLGAYDLDITADSVALGGTITGNASSILTLKPYDNNRSIGLGGGAGGFNLSDAELTGLNVGHLVIGDSASGAGDIAIQSWSLSGKSYNIELYGRDIDINGMTMGGGSITMIAGNDVTLSGAVGNSAAGGDLYIDVGNDFTNTAGAAAITMGAGGRYLVYIDTLSNITRGGMTTGNLFGRDYINDDPSTISTAFGNRFVFDETPTITVTANDVTLGAYNGAYNNFTYAVTGLATGDTAGSALSGTPAYAKTQLTPTTYSVTPSTGSLASTLGYLVSFQDGTLTMPVSGGGGAPPANAPSSPVYNIPASVEHQIQLPDLVLDQGYELMTQASPYVKSFAGSNSNLQNRIINRKSENFRVTTDEADSFTRMIEGGYLQLDQPTVDYYGLLFYNAAYSEAP